MARSTSSEHDPPRGSQDINKKKGIPARLLTVAIAIPVSLILISSYPLRIMFGLILSTLSGLELQSNFDRYIGCHSGLLQRFICTLPSTCLLILTAIYGRSALNHALFVMPFLISCLVILCHIGDREFDLSMSQKYIFAIFQCFYIGGTLAHASLLNDLPYALEALLYTIIITCIGEAFGLFGGMIFGCHHITRLSPGKTLEGYLSTALSSIMASCIFDYMLGRFYPTSLFPLHDLQLHLLSLFIAITASIGDLVESLVKRGFNVKDMGDLLPGMGGILDRLDALLFAFPTTYYYLLISNHITTSC